MKIITVMNQKGGIGKTMTAASLAYILGQEHGKKVLLVDADQQGNVSMLYDRFEPEGIGMSELLEKHRSTGGTYSTTELIQTTPYDNVDIIPANGYLMRTNMQLLLNEKEDQIIRFAAAMLEVQDAYDYCIVDCGPADGHDSNERACGDGSADPSCEGRRIRGGSNRKTWRNRWKICEE